MSDDVSAQLNSGEFTEEFGLVPAPVTAAKIAANPILAQGGLRVTAPPALRVPIRWWISVTELIFDLDVELHLGDDATPASDAVQNFVLKIDESLPAEGYHLKIGDDRIDLAVKDVAGAHAGLQTLRQLAGADAYRAAPVGAAQPLRLPAVEITDYPRSSWRGVLLDVARHFMPKNDVLRFIDNAASHKLNVVHLHLTDDQGWRVESKKYPKLTEFGSWRRESIVGTWRDGSGDGRPHGGFYTQDDLREIVGFAAQRGVTILPEIDVPGHVQAVLAAYPELSASGEAVEVRTTWGISPHVLDPGPEALEFFKNILDEVLAIFPADTIGLGGDEVPTTQWYEQEAIVQRAHDLGLSDVSELHGWFVGELARHLIAAGRRPVVWDEALSKHLPREAIVTSWRGFARGVWAAEAGHDVVMAPEQVLYLDHRASERDDEPIPVGFSRTVTDVYAFDPLPGELAEQAAAAPGDLLGAQVQVWTEHLDNPRRVDYATYPRLTAFAEAVWSPERDRAVGSAASEEFIERLKTHHLDRLAAAGIEYRPLAGPHPWQQRPGIKGFTRDLDEELAAGGLVGVGGWREGGDAPQ
ncbi:MAG TPA: beta-N-acetylhexosaminidase [Actinomycetales bacterium]|nr:beta-N-acetylhexosaminidase [Actinomycetales bacterium]